MMRSDMSKQTKLPPSKARRAMRATKPGGYQRTRVDGDGQMKGMAPMKKKESY